MASDALEHAQDEQAGCRLRLRRADRAEPAMTRANELANPVIAATMPAVIGWRIGTGFMVGSA